MKLEMKRIQKWSKMLIASSKDSGGNTLEWNLVEGLWNGRSNSGGGGGKYRKFQRRVFKGVPDRWRRAVWGLEMERIARESQEGGYSSLEELEKEYRVRLFVLVDMEVLIAALDRHI